MLLRTSTLRATVNISVSRSEPSTTRFSSTTGDFENGDALEAAMRANAIKTTTEIRGYIVFVLVFCTIVSKRKYLQMAIVGSSAARLDSC